LETKTEVRKPRLFSSKPVLVFELPDDSALSVKTAHLAKDNDQLKVEIASLDKTIANLQQNKFTGGLESQSMAEEIDRLRKERVCMQEHKSALDDE
jgi:hypothetical protein